MNFAYFKNDCRVLGELMDFIQMFLSKKGDVLVEK